MDSVPHFDYYFYYVLFISSLQILHCTDGGPTLESTLLALLILLIGYDTVTSNHVK